MIGNAILRALATSLCIAILIWHECGENPALFCYRIGYGFFKTARQRALIPAPIPASAGRPAVAGQPTHSQRRQRTDSACLTRSSIFSERCTAPMD
jgi:hypothetical protein